MKDTLKGALLLVLVSGLAAALLLPSCAFAQAVKRGGGGSTFTGGTVSSTITSTVASSGHAIDITAGARIYVAGTGFYLQFGPSGILMTPGQAFNADMYKAASGDTTVVVGGSKNDGATAVSAATDTVVSFSTTGAKIHAFRNAGTEKANVDKDGVFNGVGLTCSGATHCGTQALTAGSATVTVVSGCHAICTDTTAAAAVKCSVATTTLTITGTGTDSINYFCF